MAMGHNLRLHFGVDEHPFATYFDVPQPNVAEWDEFCGDGRQGGYLGLARWQALRNCHFCPAAAAIPLKPQSSNPGLYRQDVDRSARFSWDAVRPTKIRGP